jgi:hypothetical protein
MVTIGLNKSKILKKKNVLNSPKVKMIIIKHLDTRAYGPAAFWKTMFAMEDQM